MKYQLAIVDEFEMIWLEDLENEKLSVAHLLCKITSNTIYVSRVKQTLEEAIKEFDGYPSVIHVHCVNEMTETSRKIAKLIRIIVRKMK